MDQTGGHSYRWPFDHPSPIRKWRDGISPTNHDPVACKWKSLWPISISPKSNGRSGVCINCHQVKDSCYSGGPESKGRIFPFLHGVQQQKGIKYNPGSCLEPGEPFSGIIISVQYFFHRLSKYANWNYPFRKMTLLRLISIFFRPFGYDPKPSKKL